MCTFSVLPALGRSHRVKPVGPFLSFRSFLSACAIFFANSPGASQLTLASPLSLFWVPPHTPQRKPRLELLAPSNHNGVLNSVASKPILCGIRLVMRDKFSVFGLPVSGPVGAVREDKGVLLVKLPGGPKSDNSFPGLSPSGHVTCFHYGFPPNSTP